MNQGYPRLLGDIGGTNARWAWQESAGAGLEDISVRACQDHASIEESARQYLHDHGRARPAWAGIGIATALAGDEVQLTNSSWRFSIAAFQKALGLERCLFVNDFTALALSLPALAAAELRPVGGGCAVPGMAIALLGPGTGLGVSGLVPDAVGGYSALSGEGGHMTLAAADDAQAALLSLLRKKFDHVSAERVLCGEGLVNVYQALCVLAGQVPRALEPSDVTDAAIAASDPQCVLAVTHFTRFLGQVAGNLALMLGARGGVYIGGGVVPRLGAAFDEGLFRQCFENKGRFRPWLEAVPVWVITASTPALVGASRALDTQTWR